MTITEIEESIKSLSLTDKQRLLDTLHRELAEARQQLTVEALEDVDAGRFIDHQDVKNWAAGLGTGAPKSLP